MSGQRVTLDLPEAVLQRANQAAHALQHPIEEVLIDMLAAVLPHVDDTPPDIRAEVVGVAWLSDQELWAMARGTMPSEQEEQ